MTGLKCHSCSSEIGQYANTCFFEQFFHLIAAFLKVMSKLTIHEQDAFFAVLIADLFDFGKYFHSLVIEQP